MRVLLSMPEQDGHDQRVRKPDFDTVHKTISCAFDDSKVLLKSWILNVLLYCVHVEGKLKVEERPSPSGDL
jgi:hypothetical protein